MQSRGQGEPGAARAARPATAKPRRQGTRQGAGAPEIYHDSRDALRTPRGSGSSAAGRSDGTGARRAAAGRRASDGRGAVAGEPTSPQGLKGVSPGGARGGGGSASLMARVLADLASVGDAALLRRPAPRNARARPQSAPVRRKQLYASQEPSATARSPARAGARGAGARSATAPAAASASARAATASASAAAGTHRDVLVPPSSLLLAPEALGSGFAPPRVRAGRGEGKLHRMLARSRRDSALSSAFGHDRSIVRRRLRDLEQFMRHVPGGTAAQLRGKLRDAVPRPRSATARTAPSTERRPRPSSAPPSRSDAARGLARDSRAGSHSGPAGGAARRASVEALPSPWSDAPPATSAPEAAAAPEAATAPEATSLAALPGSAPPRHPAAASARKGLAPSRAGTSRRSAASGGGRHSQVRASTARSRRSQGNKARAAARRSDQARQLTKQEARSAALSRALAGGAATSMFAVGQFPARHMLPVAAQRLRRSQPRMRVPRGSSPHLLGQQGDDPSRLSAAERAVAAALQPQQWDAACAPPPRT